MSSVRAAVTRASVAACGVSNASCEEGSPARAGDTTKEIPRNNVKRKTWQHAQAFVALLKTGIALFLCLADFWLSDI
jgi:hypothetical protein